jgi:hypothetical protein
MAEEQKPNQGEATSPENSDTLLYKSSGEALKALGEYFKGLSGRLTDASVQMCYGLIGANWVVFGTVGNILKDTWAKLSLLMVMLTLGLNVLVVWRLTESIKKRSDWAETSKEEWTKMYEAYKLEPDIYFPFTPFQDRMGSWARWIKAIFPLLGALLLIYGAITK